MENFEKCTVAMLGGPCSQHVTGNTSRQNQPQSAINQIWEQSIPWFLSYRVNTIAGGGRRVAGGFDVKP